MRITVKKKEKKNYKSVKLVVFVLVFVLLVNTVPVKVSAAESKEDVYLMHYGNPDYCRLKGAKLPGTNLDLLLYSWYIDSDGQDCAKLYWSGSSEEYANVSRPEEIQDDETWDMDPFLFTDTDDTFNNNMIITWTDANKKFDGTETKDEIAGSMRISVSALNSSTIGFSDKILTVTKESSDVSAYNSHVTKFGDKILITWVVCSDVKNDDGAYGIEGLYYDPDTNKFSSDDNKTDAKGNLIPMVFAESCNYISTHTVAELNGSVAVLYEEAVDGTHVSDVMYDQVKQRDKVSLYSSDEFKNNKVKLAVNNGKNVDTVNLPDTYGSIVETDLPKLVYYCNGKIKEIGTDSDSTSGWKIEEPADVSKTGDARYSILSKDGSMRYITAREYSPLKIDNSEITINGMKYTKSSNGKWLDEQNKEQDIRQEDIRLYYYNNTTGKAEVLPQKLLGKDGVVFMAQPSIFINHSGMLDVTWFYANANEDMKFRLCHTTYEQQSLQKADYTAVNEVIDKVNALNKNDYEDFSAVTDAVNAVEYDKDYTEQEMVEGYAKAIEKAIKALKLRSADYTAVDEALVKVKALDADLYRNFSDVTAAVDAVDRDKNFKEQAEVDAMAAAIETAIQALTYKDADYTTVDEAIAKAKALDVNLYKDFTAVNVAIDAVVRGKNIKEQAEVDAMAKAIEDAVAALELKSANTKTETNNTNQGGAQSETNNASATDAPSVSNASNPVNTQSEASDTSEEAEDTQSEASDTSEEAEDTLSETSDENEEKGSSRTEDKSPETGDDSNLKLWITLFFLSGSGIMCMLQKKRTTKNEKIRIKEKKRA